METDRFLEYESVAYPEEFPSQNGENGTFCEIFRAFGQETKEITKTVDNYEDF